LREAVVTLTSPFPSFDGTYVAEGVLLAVALVATAFWASRRETQRLAVAAAVVAALVLVLRAASDLGFWPGLVATTPLAAVALARGWDRPERRLVLAFALVPLPFVFLFQFSGGALPQWGGRYLLTSGLLLAVVGISALGSLARWARRYFVVAAVVVTGLGLAWMSVRTHDVAVAGDALAARPEQVLVSPDGFPPREFAATYGSKDWLAVRSLDDVPRAGALVRAAGRTSFAVVSLGTTPPPTVPGFHVTGTTTVHFVGPSDFTVTSYAADGTRPS
jgi:hypothetical protein